jgi:hypothetical protein
VSALPVKSPVTFTVIDSGNPIVIEPTDAETSTSFAVPSIEITPVFEIVNEPSSSSKCNAIPDPA